MEDSRTLDITQEREFGVNGLLDEETIRAHREEPSYLEKRKRSAKKIAVSFLWKQRQALVDYATTVENTKMNLFIEKCNMLLFKDGTKQVLGIVRAQIQETSELICKAKGHHAYEVGDTVCYLCGTPRRKNKSSI